MFPLQFRQLSEDTFAYPLTDHIQNVIILSHRKLQTILHCVAFLTLYWGIVYFLALKTWNFFMTD